MAHEHESEAMTIGLDVDARAPRTSQLGVISIKGCGSSPDTVRQMLTPAALVADARRSYRHGK